MIGGRWDIPAAISATEPASAVSRHAHQWRRLVEACEDLLHRRQYDAAVTHGQIAATFASKNHVGLFSSKRLETALVQSALAASKPISDAALRQRRSKTPRRLLHVVTRGLPIGGHTRLVERWAKLDRDRSHSLAVTGQGRLPFPPDLSAAIDSSGGVTNWLDRDNNRLLMRATALRELSAACDLVVLHTDPGDVVPLLAFADTRVGPPVVLLNHADHLFWLGLLVSHVVANIRKSGQRLAVDRRGVSAERCVLLPIPLVDVNRTASRAVAKATLGVAPSTFLAVSVAASYKYQMFGLVGFIEVMTPFVQDHEEVTLLAVGPRAEGPWLTAASQTNGRMRAIGVQTDSRLLLDAADVYLDSFPCSSLTSVLEAISHGIPVVSLRMHPDEAAVLSADSPGLGNTFYPASSVAEYIGKICQLMELGEKRRAILGEQLRADVRRVHTDDGWAQEREALYQHAMLFEERVTMTEVGYREDPVDVLVERLQRSLELNGSVRRGCRGAVVEHIGLLPLSHRVTVWWKLRRTGEALRLRDLISQRIRLQVWRALVSARDVLDGRGRTEQRRRIVDATVVIASIRHVLRCTRMRRWWY